MASPNTSSGRFYMARQPIYDRSMKRVAYELLYRDGDQADSSNMDLKAEVGALANILLEVGLDRLVGTDLAYVNVPVSLLRAEPLRLLPRDRVILEILEDTPWNPEIESILRELKDAGYRLALDDYSFGPDQEPFLEYVNIVKVDVLATDPLALDAGMARLRRLGQTYLAEKVESHTEAERCHAMGFDLFQGYFYARPNTVRGSGIAAGHAVSLAFLVKLQDPNLSFNELSRLVGANVVLCHKLLRLVNSVSMAMSRKIDSIPQALLLVGTDRIRMLASLAVTTSMSDRDPELGILAMVRARYCEAVARRSAFHDPDKHFLMGLLSVLDALTDLPMTEVVAELPLAPDVRNALCGLSEADPCALTLRHVIAVERGDWMGAERLIPGVPPQTYTEAMTWALEEQSYLASVIERPNRSAA